MVENAWECSTCGNSVSASYTFCTSCGAKRPGKGWQCQVCGKDVPYADYKYCVNCGSPHRLKPKIEVKPVTAKPPPVKMPRPQEAEIPKVKPLKISKSLPSHAVFVPAKYKLLKGIGSGGFANVFQVKDPRGRMAALKVPKIDLAETMSERSYKEFLEEAKTWSKLSKHPHPNIVELYEYGSKPLPWIAMEFMDGGSLRQRLQTGALPLKDALSISVKIADALNFAAYHGVVHRDIKPENILFTKNDVPKLTDWGLAKVLLEVSSKYSKSIGTFLYMAPEQVAPKEFGGTDWRTDIYQFGAVLYEMLTGRPPFPCEDIGELFRRIKEDNPVSPSKINPKIPKELDSIALKSLEKNKEDRYEGIILLEHELKKFDSEVEK
jgi:serine/threonine protein kinase